MVIVIGISYKHRSSSSSLSSPQKDHNGFHCPWVGGILQDQMISYHYQWKFEFSLNGKFIYKFVNFLASHVSSSEGTIRHLLAQF